MPHQLFAGVLHAKNIYTELKINFYKSHSNVTWEEFLTTKFELRIDTRSITDNFLRGSGREMKKVAFYFNFKKQLKAIIVIFHAMRSFFKTQWSIWQSGTPLGF